MIMQGKRYTDASLRWSIFCMKVVGVWIASNSVEQRHRIYMLTFTVVSNLFGVYLNITDIYYTWGDFNRFIFSASNLLFVLTASMNVIVLCVHRKEFASIILYAQQNFWHLNYQQYELVLYLKCKKFCKLMIAVLYTISLMGISGYILTPLSANIGRNESDRILPFPVWVNFPISNTPYFEIMFAVQVVCLHQILAAYVTTCFLCLLNSHVVCQFQMLQHRLLNLWLAIDQRRNDIDYASKCYISLKKFIREHQTLIQYCNTIEYIYTYSNLNYMTVVSLLMCLDMYEVVLAHAPPATRLIYIFHILGSFVHIIFFTYSCHGLIQESANIGFVAYSGHWTTLPMSKEGRMLRQDLGIIMLRSQQPCCLTAGGFFPLSLETTSTLLSTTMSYFTLMRNSSTVEEN